MGTTKPSVVLPIALRPGSRIGVIAPASAPSDLAKLQRGLDYLASAGYALERAPEILTPHGYLAGTDDVRLSAINGFLQRRDIDALFCVRGGYGTLRLLPHLDYAAARRHPKLLVGYSDITALQLALYHRAGWRSLSGPMVAVEWGDQDVASEALFWQIAQGETPAPLTSPDHSVLTPMRPGTAEGVLVGGNLAVLSKLVGTPYLPNLTGAILFLEDVGEVPYKLDGLLAHLKLAGVLDQLGGVVLGQFTEGDPPSDRPSLSQDEVFADYFGGAPYPVARNLAYGHIPVKNTLPIGVDARLTVQGDRAHLDILSPVTAARS